MHMKEQKTCTLPFDFKMSIAQQWFFLCQVRSCFAGTYFFLVDHTLSNLCLFSSCLFLLTLHSLLSLTPTPIHNPIPTAIQPQRRIHPDIHNTTYTAITSTTATTTLQLPLELPRNRLHTLYVSIPQTIYHS